MDTESVPKKFVFGTKNDRHFILCLLEFYLLTTSRLLGELEAINKKKRGDGMDKEMIKLIRKSYNLNQRNFAKMVNCSFSLIALVEVGKRRVTENLENKIREAFQLNEQKINEMNSLFYQ